MCTFVPRLTNVCIFQLYLKHSITFDSHNMYMKVKFIEAIDYSLPMTTTFPTDALIFPPILTIHV